MYVDLWGWFYGYGPDRGRAGAAERRRMARLFAQAWDSFELEPHKSVALLNQGRALAVQLTDRCRALFFDYWLCEAYLFYLDNCAAALELAVRCAVELRKPEYEDCPVRARLYRVLVDAYLFTDPIGHAHKIRETIDYMETQLPLDIDTWRLLAARRAQLALAFEQFAEAKELALHYLARSEQSSFRLMDAYDLLCRIAYERKDFAAAREYAYIGETYARREKRKGSLTDYLAWQALFARKAGEEENARRLYRLAAAQFAQLPAKIDFYIYKILVDYHLSGGELELAQRLLDQQLKEVTKYGSPHYLCECYLERCRLLAQTGLPLDAELALARNAAAQLLDPARFLAKLDELTKDD